jgi:SAM-dependent methyltransferase
MERRTLNIGEALHNAKVNELATWNQSKSSAERSERQQDASNRIFDGFATITADYDGPLLKRGAPLFAMGSDFVRDLEKGLTQRGCNVISVDDRLQRPEFTVKPGALRAGFFHRFTPFAMLQEFQQAFGEAAGWDERSLMVEDGDDVIDLNYWDVGGADLSLAATMARRSLAADMVRKAADADMVVLTLGHAESWIHKTSGFHANRLPAKTLVRLRDEYELHVGSFAETVECLEAIHALIARHRSTPFQFVVAVSPVPLAKTFTARDLIVANMNSKSMLCAAAAEYCGRAVDAHYFPSYETVLYSNPQTAWRPDRTRVAPAMVDHVANGFCEAYYAPGEIVAPAAVPVTPIAAPSLAPADQLADLNSALLKAVGSVSDLLDSAMLAGALASRAAAVAAPRAPEPKLPPVPVAPQPKIVVPAFGRVTSKSAWLAAHLVCPVCTQSNFTPGGLTCLDCGTSRPLVNGVPNFITESLAIDCRVIGTENVSAHAYSPSIARILEKVAAKGGMALDCGAGSRTTISEHLVQTEIAAYSNVDVLAVNQALPFKDNSFDAAFSLDVLEHVTDPFASAREIARVLKPGGILFIDLPFLQPEHGYPHHYFNATRMGLRQLFDGVLTPEVHGVPNSGHPSTVMITMIKLYRAGLTKALRIEFDKLTVGELATIDFKKFREGPFATISDEILWKMPSTTQAVFSKPGERLLDIEPRSLPSFINRPTFEG